MSWLGVHPCAWIAGLWIGIFTAAWGDVPQSSDRPEAGEVEIIGAVAHPGRVKLSAAYLPIHEVLESVGGLKRDAYMFGAVLLRRPRDVSVPAFRIEPAICLPLPERQALVMLDSAAWFGAGRELSVKVRNRVLHRVPLKLAPLPGALRGGLAEPNLIDGDVLIVPPRPTHVYVWGKGSERRVLPYRPGWLAEDYFSEAGVDRRLLGDSERLVLPDGRILALGVNFWNYRATAVPPGALLISDTDDQSGCASLAAGNEP